jgi:hypothetical protein
MLLIMDTILILIAFALVLYFTINTVTTYNETLYIESDLDKRQYIIRRGNAKGDVYLKESANTLAEINKRVVKLVDHLKVKYERDYSKNYFIKKLSENYNSYILSEGAVDDRYTTYTIDKKDMHICLRTRDRVENVYDINLLMYVILHELAHLCNYDKNGIAIQGHGEEFRQIFKLLVIEAIRLNIYSYIDYSETPQEYCGIVISTTILPKFEYNFHINEN